VSTKAGPGVKSSVAGGSLRAPGHEGPDSALESTARQQYATLATLAPDADICPEADNLPLKAAAGVLLLEADHVAQPYLGNHQLSRREGGQVPVYLVTQGLGGGSGGGVKVLPLRGVQHLP